MATTPDHERLKKEIVEKFTPTSSYLGSHIRHTIMQSDFKVLKQSACRPSQIKKGDVFINYSGVKSRPCVVVKVLKDRTILYIPLTSTENVHCMTPYKSRFWGQGCFSKTFSVCTEEFAIDNFAGVFDNMKDLNVAVKSIKEFININL